ncbi:MAG: hypothetical protein AB8B69_12945, partial [Chitinophagales bacterium]
MRKTYFSGIAMCLFFNSLFLLFTSSTLQAQSHPWLTTSWDVMCASDMKQTLPDTADYNFECNQDNISGAAANARYDLNEASKWFKGLGFRGPVITIMPLLVFAGAGKTITDPKAGSPVKHVKGLQYLAYI